MVAVGKAREGTAYSISSAGQEFPNRSSLPSGPTTVDHWTLAMGERRRYRLESAQQGRHCPEYGFFNAGCFWDFRERERKGEYDDSLREGSIHRKQKIVGTRLAIALLEDGRVRNWWILLLTTPRAISRSWMNR